MVFDRPRGNAEVFLFRPVFSDLITLSPIHLYQEILGGGVLEPSQSACLRTMQALT